MRTTLPFVAFVLCAVLVATTVTARQPENSAPSVGDQVILELTGELAGQYYKLQTSRTEIPSGTQISTFAEVVQKLKDGQYRLEHVQTINSNSGEPRMITLTATVNANVFTQSVVPVGTAIYTSPADPNPSNTTKPHNSCSVSLTELSGVVLRSWKLDREFSK